MRHQSVQARVSETECNYVMPPKKALSLFYKA